MFLNFIIIINIYTEDTSNTTSFPIPLLVWKFDLVLVKSLFASAQSNKFQSVFDLKTR